MIRLDRRTFADQFSAVSACVPSRTTKDVLKNVLLVSDGSQTELVASTGEIHMRTTIDAAADKVKILLPSQRVRDVLREVPDETITLELIAGKIMLNCGYSSFQLQAADAAEFPPVPKFGNDAYWKVAGTDLSRMIRRTIWATDKDSTRYALGGVQMELSRHHVTCAATDSRRLCVAESSSISVEGHMEASVRAVVPEGVMKLVENAIGDGIDQVLIAFGSNDVAFRCGGTVISGQLVQGRFPDYTKVIPTQDSINTRVAIVAKSMLALVRQANLVTAKESRGVDLNFTKDELIVSSCAAEIGQAKVRMPISLEGRPIKITLDGQYLKEYLAVIAAENETSQLGLISHDDRVLCNCGDFQHVIIPLSKD